MGRLTILPWQREIWSQLVGWRERLPHAVLLYGARGIGKHRLAEAYAQFLLCESPRSDTACGECAGCQLLAADNHPDLRRLVPEADLPEREDAEAEEVAPARESRVRKPSREILIDQVREIRDFLAVSSHRGGRRIVLLSPAEALNGAAANALLKMLEEPPAGAVFVAVSDQLDAVLPTIRSRCVLVRVPAPGTGLALAWLREQGVQDAEARLAEAGGAPVGLELEDSGEEDARRLDPALRDKLLKLLARGATLSAAEVASGVPKDVPVAASIRLFQRWGWDLLAERQAARVRYYPGERRVLTALARAVEPARLLDWVAGLAQSQAVSDHPLNARLVIENALLGYIDAMQPQR
jgi:DNA polymerase-3 subunit delta'